MSTNRFDRVVPTIRAGLALTALMLPLVSISADVPVPAAQAEKLEWLLASHDVRYVMPASRARASDCMRGERE
jgi:hypothetical protein